MGIAAPTSREPQIAQRSIANAWLAFRLRWKRRRFLFRVWRKRRQLATVVDRTNLIGPNTILAASTVRNEIVRLPHFLAYYRKLGVGHFLIVDNESDDGTRAYLADQPDVSLWSTADSYKLARFGVDWLSWLLIRYAHGHWCLTVDADEILVYPYSDVRPLPELTGWLEQQGEDSFGALMLDMYPKGPLNDAPYLPGDDPIKAIPWFDSDNYSSKRHPIYDNLWIQGGVRARVFFGDRPERAPTLNKVPLVRWDRQFVYVSSTHQMLPRRLNRVFDLSDGKKTTGVLLHTKFLNVISEKSSEEIERRQHFENSDLYERYHIALTQNPDFWCADSKHYEGWEQLVDIGLMSKGNWG